VDGWPRKGADSAMATLVNEINVILVDIIVDLMVAFGDSDDSCFTCLSLPALNLEREEKC